MYIWLLVTETGKMWWRGNFGNFFGTGWEMGRNGNQKYRLQEVSFLGYPHRHIFHFKVWIEVFHDDRDIEFIQFKRWLESLYQGTLELDYKSCEMIADELAHQIQIKHPGRHIRIEVSEDGENGCDNTYQKAVN